MLASPVLLTTLKALEMAQSMGADAHLDSVLRDVRMAEADVRAAVEAFHAATDDAGRLHAVLRRNRTMKWVADLLVAYSNSLSRSAPTL